MSSLLNDALNAFVSWLIFFKTHSVNFLYKFFFFFNKYFFYKLSCCFKLFLLLFIHLFVVFLFFIFNSNFIFFTLSILFDQSPQTVACCYRCCYCCCGDEYIFNCGWLLSYWFPLVSGYALCLKNKKNVVIGVCSISLLIQRNCKSYLISFNIFVIIVFNITTSSLFSIKSYSLSGVHLHSTLKQIGFELSMFC